MDHLLDQDLRQFDAIFDAVTAAIGDAIVSVYRYGSAVNGGLRPASDLDVFVVTDRPMNDGERQTLIEALLRVSGRDFRPAEVTVAQLSSLVPWPDSPLRDFQFGEWLRQDFENGYLSPPQVDHDLAPLVATVLTSCEALVGPSAKDLLVPVPQQRLVLAMQAGVDGLLDDLDDDTTNVLLTLCRMLLTAATGSIESKDAAASWVIETLDLRNIDTLSLARARYLQGRAGQPAYDPERVQETATKLAAAVRGIAGDQPERPWQGFLIQQQLGSAVRK